MSRADESQRGSIFAIGGREERVGDIPVLEHFVSLCGGVGSRIVVIATASQTPLEKISEYQTAFRSLGVENLSCFWPEDRMAAGDPALLEAIDAADGVFLTGGNQLKLTTTLAGTPFETRLRECHLKGLHLAGTSAGASALSAVMMARGRARSAARLSSIRMTPGFGFIPNVIVDQHFRERDRFGRLFAAVLCNPAMLGFGLDEDTAFELDASGGVSVVGSRTLTIVDGTQLDATDIQSVPEDTPAGFSGMRVHVLSSGWTYDMLTRRVQPPPPVPEEEDAFGEESH